MATNDDRPRFIERAQRAVKPEDPQRNRSNGMITLGVVLFVLVGFVMAASPEGSSTTPALLIGILGAGLIVGGLVIRR